jgi:putative metalloprotease
VRPVTPEPFVWLSSRWISGPAVFRDGPGSRSGPFDAATRPRVAHLRFLASSALAVATLLLATVAPGRAADTQQKLVAKGRAEAEMLWRRGYALGDTALDNLLQRTLDAVTAGVARPPGVRLRASVFRSPEQNAFALPDGSIFVFAGLLSTFTDFRQVAFVLAHEAQHALGQHAARHVEQTDRTAAMFEAISFVTAIALASSNSSSAGLVNDFAQLGLNLSAMAAINGYGRGLEREADLAAIGFVTAAGYDACGGVEAMQALQLHEKQPGRLSNVFWGNHPLLAERIRYLREAPGAAGCAFDSTRVAEDYALHKWTLAKLSAALWLTGHEPGKALQLAQAYSQVFPDDAGIYVTIGDALTESARPETLSLAVQAYERARSLAPDDRSPLRGLATVAEIRGDTTACIHYLERYLEGDAPVRDRRVLRRKLVTLRTLLSAAAVIADTTGLDSGSPTDSTGVAAPRSGYPQKDR